MVKISSPEHKIAFSAHAKNLRKDSLKLSTHENSDSEGSFVSNSQSRVASQSHSDSGAPQALGDLLVTLTSLLKV